MCNSTAWAVHLYTFTYVLAMLVSSVGEISLISLRTRRKHAGMAQSKRTSMCFSVRAPKAGGSVCAHIRKMASFEHGNAYCWIEESLICVSVSLCSAQEAASVHYERESKRECATCVCVCVSSKWNLCAREPAKGLMHAHPHKPPEGCKAC